MAIAPCSWACWLTLADRVTVDRTSLPPTPPGSTPSSARSPRLGRRPGCRRHRPVRDAESRLSTAGSPKPKRPSPSIRRASTSRPPAPTRSTPSSTATWLTGRIGRPGMGPFSVTGQPNAMGGREVGGLANMLAAHMDFTPEAIDRVGRFWGSDNVATKPGPQGRRPLRRHGAWARSRPSGSWRPIRSIRCPRPTSCAPRCAACPFVVVSDMSAQHRYRRRPPMSACPQPAGARRTARSPIPSAASRASVRSSRCPARPARTGGSSRKWPAHGLCRCLRLSRSRPRSSPSTSRCPRSRMTAAAISISPASSARTMPACRQRNGRCATGQPRACSAMASSSRRTARRASSPCCRHRHFAPAPGRFILNTGRVRDHWHTMTRTGKAARLSAHYAEPFVEIHPADAAER